jgi:signal transduction histidine kinase
MARPHRLDLLVALALFGAGTAQLLIERSEPLGEVALTIPLCLPLAWRRSAALPATLICTLAAATLGVAYPESGEFVVPLAMILTGYSAGRHLEPPRLYAAAGGLVAIMWTGLALTDAVPTDYVFTALLFGGFIAFGQALRRRVSDVAAERAERERAERHAVVDERARIARELHDIVSHSITAIVLQSQAIGRRLEPGQTREREDLRSIETTARQAMTEMRRLFGVLRSQAGEGPEALAPQPGLDQLPRLLDEARGAGTEIAFREHGERVPLAPGVDLVAYRIIQEALTNVRKHAPGARAEVSLAFGDGALAVEIADDGPGARANGHAGHGLVGMRERVALYGGRLATGDGPDGGYRVHARLPL